MIKHSKGPRSSNSKKKVKLVFIASSFALCVVRELQGKSLSLSLTTLDNAYSKWMHSKLFGRSSEKSTELRTASNSGQS